MNIFGAVQYLTPTGYSNSNGIVEPETWNFNAAPSVQWALAPGVRSRISADADPETGYLSTPSFAGEPGNPNFLQGGWGGTSFVAPQLNGSTAVIDAALGHRVGFWNPQIYKFATSWNSPFTPLDQSGTSNDNDFYTGTPGTVYNEATGLGTRTSRNSLATLVTKSDGTTTPPLRILRDEGSRGPRFFGWCPRQESNPQPDG